jgi:hypothetical protein
MENGLFGLEERCVLRPVTWVNREKDTGPARKYCLPVELIVAAAQIL